MSPFPGNVNWARVVATLLVGSVCTAHATTNNAPVFDLVGRATPSVQLQPVDLPRPVIAFNRAGFHPSWPKPVTITAPNATGDVTWTLLDPASNKLASGTAPFVDVGRGWSQATIALDEVAATGAFLLVASSSGITNPIRETVRVNASIVDELIEAQLALVAGMRCGDMCHIRAMQAGGYHDASDSYNTSVETVALLSRSLVRWLELRPDLSKAGDELERAVGWVTGAVDDSRVAGRGVVSEPGAAAQAPWADRSNRTWDPSFDVRRNAIVAGCAGRAAVWIRDHRSRERGVRYLTKAENAYIRIHDSIDASEDSIVVAWAAMELYRATKDALYLSEARKVVIRLVGGSLAAAECDGVARRAAQEVIASYAELAPADDPARDKVRAYHVETMPHTGPVPETGYEAALQDALRPVDRDRLVAVIGSILGSNRAGASRMIGVGEPAHADTLTIPGTGPIRGGIVAASDEERGGSFNLRTTIALLDALRVVR